MSADGRKRPCSQRTVRRKESWERNARRGSKTFNEVRRVWSQANLFSVLHQQHLSALIWREKEASEARSGLVHPWSNLLVRVQTRAAAFGPIWDRQTPKNKTLQRSRFRVLFCVCVEQSQWKTSQVYLTNRGSPGATDPSDLTWIGRQGSVLRRQSDRQRRSGHVFHNCERLDDDVLSLPFSASKWSNGIHTKVTQHILNLLVSDVLYDIHELCLLLCSVETDPSSEAPPELFFPR